MSDNRACYYPDGSKAKDTVPCTAKDNTACCGVNDICLSNGYCLGVKQPFALTRGACTNQKWTGGCPGHCRTVNTSGGCPIVNLKTANGVNSYCCGPPVGNGSAAVCRDSPDSFPIDDAQILTGRAALANLIVPPDSPSNISNSPVIPSNSSIPAPTSSNSHDTTIGVGLGITLGVIAIGSLIWALWERRRAKKLSRAMMASSFPAQEGLVRSPQAMLTPSSVPTELDSQRQMAELMPREHV